MYNKQAVILACQDCKAQCLLVLNRPSVHFVLSYSYNIKYTHIGVHVCFACLSAKHKLWESKASEVVQPVRPWPD